MNPLKTHWNTIEELLVPIARNYLKKHEGTATNEHPITFSERLVGEQPLDALSWLKICMHYLCLELQSEIDVRENRFRSTVYCFFGTNKLWKGIMKWPTGSTYRVFLNKICRLILSLGVAETCLLLAESPSALQPTRLWSAIHSNLDNTSVQEVIWDSLAMPCDWPSRVILIKLVRSFALLFRLTIFCLH